MWRAWIILSTLVLSVLFKLFHKHGVSYLNDGKDWTPVDFPFSESVLNLESWVYFLMQHINEAAIAFIIPFQDRTPKFLLWLYFAILISDGLHFVLFYRDEGIGFNVFKVILFGAPLLYLELKNLWTLLKQ